jgi:hypothetical protein
MDMEDDLYASRLSLTDTWRMGIPAQIIVRQNSCICQKQQSNETVALIVWVEKGLPTSRIYEFVHVGTNLLF